MLVEVNPLIVTADRKVDGARRQGHARRQLALPPPRQRRAARRRRRGPAGADGQGARADLRQARRQRRHPRQRRRARDVDARRRRPGRRQARELPRRRRRLEGRGDHPGGRGDPLRREGHRRAVQHLRRHHALRRGRQGPDRGVRPDQADRAVRGAARRHQRRGGPPRCWPRPTCPTSTPSRRCSAPPSASSSWRATRRAGGEPEGETVPPGEGTETELGAADTRAEAGS